jgi:hypothetical protein
MKRLLNLGFALATSIGMVACTYGPAANRVALTTGQAAAGRATRIEISAGNPQVKLTQQLGAMVMRIHWPARQVKTIPGATTYISVAVSNANTGEPLADKRVYNPGTGITTTLTLGLFPDAPLPVGVPLEVRAVAVSEPLVYATPGIVAAPTDTPAPAATDSAPLPTDAPSTTPSDVPGVVATLDPATDSATPSPDVTGGPILYPIDGVILAEAHQQVVLQSGTITPVSLDLIETGNVVPTPGPSDTPPASPIGVFDPTSVYDAGGTKVIPEPFQPQVVYADYGVGGGFNIFMEMSLASGKRTLYLHLADLPLAMDKVFTFGPNPDQSSLTLIETDSAGQATLTLQYEGDMKLEALADGTIGLHSQANVAPQFGGHDMLASGYSVAQGYQPLSFQVDGLVIRVLNGMFSATAPSPMPSVDPTPMPSMTP